MRTTGGSSRFGQRRRARELLEAVGLGDRIHHHPSKLSGDEQELWAKLAGRQVRIEERQAFAEKLAKTSRECRELFLMACAAENPNRKLRLAALGDRVSTKVDRSDFDDLVSIVSSSPIWESTGTRSSSPWTERVSAR